jgi:hypothetical protein
VALREVAVIAGVQADSKELVGLMAVVDTAISKFQSLASALPGLAFAYFERSQISAGAELGKNAAKANLSAEEYQRLSFVLERSGLAAEEVSMVLFHLSRAAGEAASGTGPAADALRKLGISLKDSNGHTKNAATLLPEISEGLSKVDSDAERTALSTTFFSRGAREMGIFAKLGAKGIAGLNDEFAALGGPVSNEAIANARAASREFSEIGTVSSALSQELASTLYPAIIRIAEVIKFQIARFREFAKHTTILQSATAALTLIMGGGFLVAGYRLIQMLSVLRVSVLGVSAPFLLVAAVVGALYLLFDDFWALLHGGKSVIGGLVDKLGLFGGKEKFVAKIKEAWLDFQAALPGVIESVKSLWASVTEGVKENGLLEWIGDAIDEFNLLLDIARAVGAHDWKRVGELNDIGQAMSEGKLTEYSNFGARVRGDAKHGALTEDSDTGGSSPRGTSVTSSVDITVHAGSLDPATATKAVREGVAKGLHTSTQAAYKAVSTGAPVTLAPIVF